MRCVFAKNEVKMKLEPLQKNNISGFGKKSEWI